MKLQPCFLFFLYVVRQRGKGAVKLSFERKKLNEKYVSIHPTIHKTLSRTSKIFFKDILKRRTTKVDGNGR